MKKRIITIGREFGSTPIAKGRAYICLVQIPFLKFPPNLHRINGFGCGEYLFFFPGVQFYKFHLSVPLFHSAHGVGASNFVSLRFNLLICR